MASVMPTNFAFLEAHSPQLVRLGTLAEQYFKNDPNTSLIKLRQFGELLARMVAAHVGIYSAQEESQVDLLRRLRDHGLLGGDAGQLFHNLRLGGNRANHALVDDHSMALSNLRYARELGIWFHRAMGGNVNFRPGPFIPPSDPAIETKELKEQLEQLRQEAERQRALIEDAQLMAEEAKRVAEAAQAAAMEEHELRAIAEQLMLEAEAQAQVALEQLAAIQASTYSIPAQTIQQFVVQAQQAEQNIVLDEAQTRQIIDQQLQAAGWEADSQKLTYGKGIRPQKGRNLAIAEWPTEHGRADYALFLGLELVAVVEAKRQSRDVSASIDQAKRYSKDYVLKGGETLPDGAPWGEFRVPFVFATNGRPYLRQIETKSGIWFCDVRRSTNLRRPLQNWYSPEGLRKSLEQNHEESHKKLAAEGFEYNLELRDYQIRAIQAIENALADDQRMMLVAMATGTGKTKTAIVLAYRLLKTKRFRRVLFLVDRSVLGEQTENAFKDSRLENLQTFTDIFDMKGLKDASPDPDTKVHISTIQGFVKRLLFPSEGSTIPTPDQYDCIIVDECHRGYLLDREMSDAELSFRDFDDYVSKYRRVLEYFDAVKIGLTATPALHTREIFGSPVFQYTYSEAVADGWLIPHEPPVRIVTALSEDGIVWQAGERMMTYNPQAGISYIDLPDEVVVGVEEFNKRVVTEEFNRVICEALAQYIDPQSQEKTLIFCVTDDHADIVVRQLKQAMADMYGDVDDDAIKKITGKADQPRQLTRRFRNETLPNIAVTVDLLTTGIDVPPICNLVFIRRVSSRILFEQMLGRATRRCDDISKEVFRVYDAVDMYSAIEQFSTMRPAVVNPKLPFEQLLAELVKVDNEEALQGIADQLIAKLLRKRSRLDEVGREAVEGLAGMTVEDLVNHLRQLPPKEMAAWLGERPALVQSLDTIIKGVQSLIISEHGDELRRIERGYGSTSQPQDYLDGFKQFLHKNQNLIPALLVVTQRPRELTRAQLKEVNLLLASNGYSETNLRTAWRDMTNQDIAATIVGFIRQATLGDALVPYEERVDRAMKKIRESRAWTPPQRQWLDRIGNQLKKEVVVDRAALDRGQFQANGGFNRLNKVFNGELENILAEINGTLWQAAG
jgi:type I restriction enzyme, R subunit